MLRVFGSVLKNIVVFDEAQIPFTGKGLVVVSGRNKDCLESEDQTNMTGKSLSLSSVPNVVYYSTPLSVKKNSKKDMLGQKDSSITLYLEHENTKYKLVQGQKETRIFEKEGGKYVDQSYRTDKLQREKIAKIFPLSQQEFYSYVYIQSQRPLEFQTGSPTSRLKFITQAFPQLGIYDRLHSYFSIQLSKVKKGETKYDVLITKYKDTISRIKKLKLPKDAEKKAKDLNSKLDKVSDGLDSLIEEETKLKGIIKAHSKYKEYSKELNIIMDKLSPLNVKKLDKALEVLKSDLKSIAKIQRYEDSLASREKTVTKIESKLKKLKKPSISKKDAVTLGKELRSKATKLTSKLEAMEDTMETYEKALDEYTEIKNRLNKIAKGKKDFDLSLSDIDEKIGLLKSNLALEDLIHEHKNGQCPTCLQSVDVKRIKRLVKSSSKELKELKRKRSVVKLKNTLDGITLPEKVNQSSIEKIRSKIVNFESKIEEMEDVYTTHSKIETLQSSLSDIPKVKKPKVKFGTSLRSEEEVYDKISLVESALKLRDRLDNIKDNYPNIEKSNIPTLENITSKKEKLRSKQKKLNDTYQTLTNSISNHELLKSQYDELRKEIAELKPFITKRKTFEHLVSVYGNKGLKLEATKSILKLLEDKMNEYGHLIFTEAVSFKLKTVAQGVTCSILRDNQNADVHVLSGAETNCFRLLFMIAMLSLVPESRRTNFVVLDEADSAMSDASREKYITQFIPALKEVVERVFVITPKDTNLYQDADFWVVEKHKGRSRLLNRTTGKPVTLKRV